jgi:predicted dehydrogenase
MLRSNHSDSNPIQVSRRSFLKVTAVAGLSAASYSHILGANERLAIGHIGTGGRGTSLLRQTLAQPELAVAALSDVDRNHLARAKELAGNARTHGDFRKILDHKEVDAVVVGTPDHWHCPIAQLAVGAGKDVYCEKPLSHNLAEGRQLVLAARRYGRIIQVGTQHRTEEQILEVAELVRSGRIGKVHTVELWHPSNPYAAVTPNAPPPEHLDWDTWLGPAPVAPYHPKRCHFNFRFFYDYAGGYLTDNGVHMINVVSLAMNNDLAGPVSVEGHEEPFPEENLFACPKKQYVKWTFKKPDFVMTWSLPGEEGDAPGLGMRFLGETGTLVASFGKHHILRGGKVVEEPKPGTKTGDVKLARVPGGNLGDWIRAMRSRKPPINDVEIGHRNVSISHVGNIASRLALPIRFDPKTERFLDNDKANAMLSRTNRSPWNQV